MHPITWNGFTSEFLKIAAESDDFGAGIPSAGALGAGASLAGMGGGHLLAGQRTREQLSGRTNLYHGTAEKNLKGILEEGIKPAGRKARGITDILPDDIKQQAKDLAYATKDKKKARTYAVQADAIQDALKVRNPNMRRHALAKARAQAMQDPKNAVRIATSDRGVAHVNIPMWKLEDAGRVVANPEARGSFAEFRKAVDPINIQAEDSLRRTHRALKDARVFRGGIDAKYIKGGKHYQRLGLSELKDYIKARPGQFAAGVGRAAGGGALLAGSGYLAYKGYQQAQKGRTNEQ